MQQFLIDGLRMVQLYLVKHQPPSPSLLSDKLTLLAMESMCARQQEMAVLPLVAVLL